MNEIREVLEPAWDSMGYPYISLNGAILVNVVMNEINGAGYESL